MYKMLISVLAAHSGFMCISSGVLPFQSLCANMFRVVFLVFDDNLQLLQLMTLTIPFQLNFVCVMLHLLGLM